MLLLFTSDLHGQAGHYQALTQLAASLQPDALILGGNLFPDEPSHPVEEIGKRQPLYVLEVFRGWLNGLCRACPNASILTIFGNHDWLSSAHAMDELAAQNKRLTVLSHDHPFELGGLSFLGYSRTPPTHSYVKDFERLDLPGDKPPLVGGARWDPIRKKALPGPAKAQFAQFPSMAEELERITVPAGPWVFVCNTPPFDSLLDRDFHREPIGSKAVKTFIGKRQPLLALHGHVKESPDVTGEFRQQLGQTTCVNPGQHVEVLCTALVEVDVAARSIVRVERRRPS